MRRLGWIVTGLVALAVVEVVVLILVGQAIGALWTFLLILLTSGLGLLLLRREGVRAWRLFRDDLRSGRPPGNTATEGLLVLIGGILLVVPGFLTDLVGAVLLLPPTRRLTRAVLLRRFGDRLSPDVANSLFGPRRVRAKAGQAQPYADQVYADAAPRAGAPVDSPTIEGEIIDPR